MSVATAAAVFDFSYGNGGAIIEKFKDAEALGDYLNQSGGTSGGLSNVASLSLSGAPLLAMGSGGEDTFRIKMIGNLPVVAIQANAFNPDTLGVADITSVVKRVVLPETITELGSNLFAGVAAEITVEIPPVVTERVGSNPDNLHGILGGEAKIEIKDEAAPQNEATVIEPTVPTVSGVTVSGNPGSLTVTLTYSAAVNSVSLNGNSSGWSGFTGSGTTFTTTYSGSTDESPVTLGYRAGYSGGTKTAALSVPLATGNLERNGGPKTYQFFAYDALNYAVGLKTATVSTENEGPKVENNTQTTWYRLAGTKTDDTTRNIFNAIYAPNSPTSRDGFVEGADPGKTAVPYDKTISDTVLKLFYVTLGTNADGDKVYIKGETLPTATGASVTNLIIIDVGVPGGNGSGLPKFYIPVQGLGSATVVGGLQGGTQSQGQYASDTTYSHIRLRVNNGAHLVILADNSNYENGNAGGKACPPGKFAGGVVEVVKGGQLRDGAWEGFPLGNNAVILNRTGSYLAIGSESAFEYQWDYNNNRYQVYYSGWIIGPEQTNTRIVWDGGPPAQYIEVRPGKLATNANVTVKKTMGLIYSVWFVGNTRLTIDAANDNATPSFGTDAITNVYPRGLGVDPWSGTFKFYGNPGASIILKEGSSIMEAPLGGTLSYTEFTTAHAGSGSTTINAYQGPAGSLGTYIDNGADSIKGYNSWAKQTQ
jgi:hypothetical protein